MSICQLFLMCLSPLAFQTDTGLTKIVYGAGYIPNVQFAPFYVATARGYYAQEGLDVEIDYTIGPDILKLTALGRMQLASADPDAFLHARTQDLPLVHVATLYQAYPLALIAKEPILDGTGLAGKRVGISGTYGSSYLALKAMLAEMDLKLSDINLATIGFTQVAALQRDRVDAVIGYINNEPLRLKSLGVNTFTRTLSAERGIPGVGLMTSPKFLNEHPEKVRGFLRATFRGVQDVLSDPEACYALTVEKFLPELKGEERYEAEYQTLLATLPFWESEYTRANGLGQSEPGRWEELVRLLQQERGDGVYAGWRNWINREFHLRAEN